MQSPIFDSAFNSDKSMTIKIVTLFDFKCTELTLSLIHI